MSLRTTRFQNGERFVLIAAGPKGLPDYWVAGYTLKVLRPKGLSTNSVRNILEGIEKGLSFCRARGIADLRARALKRPLTDDELTAFARACSGGSGKTGYVINAADHYSAFLKFFLWLGDQPTADAGHSAIDRAVLNQDFVRRIGLCKPGRRGGTPAIPRLGLTLSQRDTFQRVIIPGAEGNPFEAMAFRNFTLMTMAFDLGLRSGELLGLKVEDLDFRSGRVSIQRRPDDPDDTRGKSALQKTSARVLPMAEHLSLACEELLKDRRSFKAARRHPYLFVNHLGEPLGDRGLRKAYQALRDAVPELGDLINHMLRHDWNDRWVDMMTDHPDWNREECQADQLYAMGWRPGSPMPFLYGKRSREALANKRLLQNQMAERVKAEDQ